MQCGKHYVVSVPGLVQPPLVAVALLQGEVRIGKARPLVELDDAAVQLVAAVGHARGQGLKLVPFLGQVQEALRKLPVVLGERGDGGEAVCAEVPLHADRADWQDGHAQGGVAVLAENPARVQRGKLLFGSLVVGDIALRHPAVRAEDVDAQARPGEGVAHDKLVRQADFLSDGAHLVLVEVLERLDDEPLFQKLLYAVNAVVVGLDDVGILGPARLYDVRVQGPLGKKPDRAVISQAQAGNDRVAHLDEVLAHRHPLLLRVGQAGDGGKEGLARVLAYEVREAVHLIGLGDPAALVLAHEAVVYVQAQHLVLAQGLVQQGEGDGGIHPARQEEEDLPVPRLCAYALHYVIQDAVLVPVPLHPADAGGEVLEYLVALGRVLDLAVALKGEALP